MVGWAQLDLPGTDSDSLCSARLGRVWLGWDGRGLSTNVNATIIFWFEKSVALLLPLPVIRG